METGKKKKKKRVYSYKSSEQGAYCTFPEHKIPSESYLGTNVEANIRHSGESIAASGSVHVLESRARSSSVQSVPLKRQWPRWVEYVSPGNTGQRPCLPSLSGAFLGNSFFPSLQLWALMV